MGSLGKGSRGFSGEESGERGKEVREIKPIEATFVFSSLGLASEWESIYGRIINEIDTKVPDGASGMFQQFVGRFS